MNFAVSHFRTTPDQSDLMIDSSIAIINRLSRTFQGESNTEVSALKEPLLLTGGALALKVRANFKEAAKVVMGLGREELRTADDAAILLLDLSSLTNKNLLQPGRSPFRTWETGIAAHTPVQDIPAAFHAFAGEFSSLWKQGFSDPVYFAAWMERRSNAEGHFFTDGCGRLSRCVSVGVLARHGFCYPAFEDRADYFHHLLRPFDEWVNIYREYVARGSEEPRLPPAG